MITESLRERQGTIRVGSEQIVDDLTESVVERNYADFFDRYTQISNLFIDNLWILQSRPNAAKEIGKLLKARMDSGKLTVLASDLSCRDVIQSLPEIGECLVKKGTIHLNMAEKGSESGTR